MTQRVSVPNLDTSCSIDWANDSSKRHTNRSTAPSETVDPPEGEFKSDNSISNASSASTIASWLRHGPSLNYWVRRSDNGAGSKGYLLTIQSPRHLVLTPMERPLRQDELCS
eukprot:GEMP01055974.1.p1 GENE.GEMP01055974.1~~GEMP01055974.1.p1  ORF type:complete len:112 (+),score=15.68 GEMP01055974.1:150-485(+)